MRKNRDMPLDTPVPGPVRWILRAAAYGVVALVLLALLTPFEVRKVAHTSATCVDRHRRGSDDQTDALTTGKAIARCLKAENDVFGNWLQRRTHAALQSLPNAPAAFVGTWISSRPGCTYEIQLGDDSDFTARPIDCPASDRTYTGSWGVFKDQLVWLPNQDRVWPPDINRIESRGASSFVLVEEDGSRTRFTRTTARTVGGTAR